MYEEHFGFSGPPFRLNPDPKFFFGSRSHNKAMAYLHYGLRQGEGFIVITGEIGAGKSMLIGHLIDQLDRSNVVAAHLLTTQIEPDALLSHVLSAFRIEPAGEGKTAEIDAFEDFLFDQMNRGRRVLLIVDEAQNLPIATIEALRMLSNMDYDGTPLFQVFLVGQPEFRATLARPDMEQFRQRVIASYHLEPLVLAETREYVEHRLSLVGWTGKPSFSEDAFKRIFFSTGGVPRKINRLANRILLHCAIEKLEAVDGAVVDVVYADLKGESLERVSRATAPVADEDENVAPPAAAAPAPFAPTAADTASVAAAQARARASARGEATPKIARAAVLPEPQPAGPRVAPASETAGGQQSALDRLRALKAGARFVGAIKDPEPATLVDVKRAIEEASLVGPAPITADPRAQSDFPPTDDASISAEAAAAVEELATWRNAVAQSIDEARRELKSAYAQVASLRRRLTEIEDRRRDRRLRIDAGLSRAEALLSELRNAAQ